MSRLLAALGMLLFCACSTNKYTAMPDGSKPVLYAASTVLSWPMVDGMHQAPSGRARISIDESARLESGVEVGDGVRIGAKAFLDEDAILMPNVSVGDETRIGDDVIVGSGVKVGSNVSARRERRGQRGIPEKGVVPG